MSLNDKISKKLHLPQLEITSEMLDMYHKRYKNNDKIASPLMHVIHDGSHGNDYEVM